MLKLVDAIPEEVILENLISEGRVLDAAKRVYSKFKSKITAVDKKVLNNIKSNIKKLSPSQLKKVSGEATGFFGLYVSTGGVTVTAVLAKLIESGVLDTSFHQVGAITIPIILAGFVISAIGALNIGKGERSDWV